MNMQLESIHLDLHKNIINDDYYDGDLWYCDLDEIPIISDLPKLKTFEIKFDDHVNVRNSCKKNVHFEHLNHLKIRLHGQGGIHNLKILINNLHTLHFDCYIDKNVMNFCTSNKSIESIECAMCFLFGPPSVEIVESFASLPNLQTLKINSGPGATIEFYINLIKSCKSLNVLILQCDDTSKFDVIITDPELKDHWMFIIEESNKYIFKKIKWETEKFQHKS